MTTITYHLNSPREVVSNFVIEATMEIILSSRGNTGIDICSCSIYCVGDAVLLDEDQGKSLFLDRLTCRTCTFGGWFSL